LAINEKGKRVKIPRPASIGILFVGAFLLFKVLILLWATLQALHATIDYKNSRGTKIEYLTNTPPTSTFKLTFEYEIYRFKLKQARLAGSITADELNQYIAWAENYLTYAPFTLVYKQLADALLLKGEKVRALAVLAEATLIFPDNVTLKKYYDRVKRGGVTPPQLQNETN
jgi:hypothetical protein